MSRDNEVGFAGVIGFLFGATISMCVVGIFSDRAWERYLVKEGHAEYVLEDDTAVWKLKPMSKELK